MRVFKENARMTKRERPVLSRRTSALPRRRCWSRLRGTCVRRNGLRSFDRQFLHSF